MFRMKKLNLLKQNGEHNRFKGFTLVELLGVITLTVVVCMLVMPPIINQINKKKSEMTSVLEQEVYAGANLYVSNNNSNLTPVSCVKLSTLVDDDYLDSSIYDNVKNDDRFNENAYIKITKSCENYAYELSNTCEPDKGYDQGYIDGKNASTPHIVDLGTSATIDVSKVTGIDDYHTFTSSNFIVSVISASGSDAFVNEGPDSDDKSSYRGYCSAGNVTKSYDATTGILTISNLSGSYSSKTSQVTESGYLNISVRTYLVY